MKNFFLGFLFFTFFTVPLLAQQPLKVPAAVKIQFMEDYITGTDEIWSKKDNYFVVQFFHHGHEKAVAYTEDGQCIFMQTHVSEARVPSTVLEKLAKTYDEFNVNDIVLTESADTTTYTFSLIIKESIANVTINCFGRMVR